MSGSWLRVACSSLAGCSTGTDAVERGTEFQFVSPGGQTEIFYDGEDRQRVPPCPART